MWGQKTLMESGGINSGATYIFEKPSGGWTDIDLSSATATATIQGANTASYSLGTSVAISGDSAIAGAEYIIMGLEELTLEQPIFLKSLQEGGPILILALLQRQQLSWELMMVMICLVASVAISGDTVIVGAEHFDGSGGIGSGAAYIFEKPSGGWANIDLNSDTADKTIQGANAYDNFGNCCSCFWRYRYCRGRCF